MTFVRQWLPRLFFLCASNHAAEVTAEARRLPDPSRPVTPQVAQEDQAPHAPSPDNVRSAVELAYRARELFEQREYDAAYVQFAAAEELAHSPVFTLHMARCLRNLGRWLEARALYEQTAREQPIEEAPPAFLEAQRDAEAELVTLLEELPTLTLAIQGNDAAAHVHIDQEAVPFPVVDHPLDPGSHEVLVEVGTRRKLRRVKLAPSDRRTLRFDMSPVRAPSLVPPAAPTGAEANDGTNPWAWTAFGVAGAGLLVGATTGIWAWRKSESLPCENRTCPEESRGETEDTKLLADITTGSFLLAGTATAVGVAILLSSDHKEEARTRTTLQVSETGVSLKTSF